MEHVASSRGPTNTVPRSLGISAPEGKEVCELYLVVKSRPQVFDEIHRVMGRMNARLLEAHMQVADEGQLAHAIYYLEMVEATSTLSDLVRALTEKDFVIEARAEPKKAVYFESMMFPITSGGHFRMFAMGGTSWVALIRSLDKTFGSAAGSILHNAGVSLGEDTVEKINRRLGTPSRELSLKNARQVFFAAGNGTLDLSGNEARFEVAIRDAIASEEEKPVIDHFLVGFVTGAIEKIFAAEYVVDNLRYENREMAFSLVRME